MVVTCVVATLALLAWSPSAAVSQVAVDECWSDCHDGAMSVYEAGGYEAGRKAYERCLDSFC